MVVRWWPRSASRCPDWPDEVSLYVPSAPFPCRSDPAGDSGYKITTWVKLSRLISELYWWRCQEGCRSPPANESLGTFKYKSTFSAFRLYRPKQSRLQKYQLNVLSLLLIPSPNNGCYYRDPYPVDLNDYDQQLISRATKLGRLRVTQDDESGNSWVSGAMLTVVHATVGSFGFKSWESWKNSLYAPKTNVGHTRLEENDL